MPTAETFAIAPAGARPLWFLVPVFLLWLAGMAFLGVVWFGSQRARFEVSPAGLRLRGDLYARLIPASRLRGGAARLVDLRTAPEYRPTRRTFGTGLPGYAAGWFRLASGEKVLLYLTDRTRAVYIPTRDGYAVLVSPADPPALLAALQRVAPGP